jgi:hypothetical protein
MTPRRTDILQDVDWRGVETERGNTLYGWHLGTVWFCEHDLEDGKRFEVYVSHPQPDGSAVVAHWRAFTVRELAEARRAALILQLREVGEHGLFARQLESCADEIVMDDGGCRVNRTRRKLEGAA